MWTALGTIALMLGLGEASKLISNWRSLTPTKASQLANQILAAAEKKGGEMLNKAINAIQNIPMLSSSPSLKSHMVEARQKAENNYNKVEQKVADMKNEASKTATEIQGMPERSTITAIKDRLFTGKSDYDRASELVNDAISKISKVENKV